MGLLLVDVWYSRDARAPTSFKPPCRGEGKIQPHFSIFPSAGPAERAWLLWPAFLDRLWWRHIKQSACSHPAMSSGNAEGVCQAFWGFPWGSSRDTVHRSCEYLCAREACWCSHHSPRCEENRANDKHYSVAGLHFISIEDWSICSSSSGHAKTAHIQPGQRQMSPWDILTDLQSVPESFSNVS